MKKLFIILIAFGFLSCDKEPVVVLEKADVIIIDVNDSSQYKYLNMNTESQHGAYIKNGEGYYHFTSKHYGGKYYLVVTTQRNMTACIPSVAAEVIVVDNMFTQTVDGSELVKFKIYYE